MKGFYALNGLMKGLKAFLSPALRLSLSALIVLSLFAPSVAFAAPTGPRDGMFDCLGDLDWGCRIIGFLFETNDNQVTYIKDGVQVVDNPSAVQSALRAILAFFSNAILIIASLKLLYELIQMVAETAHTGQVGGKDANKLWAPIRLVVAIGLLVPLSSGLNSGQYIIMQVAKWGSGLASQTWKVFAEKLSSNDQLASPLIPRHKARELVTNAFKNYACMEIMNHHQSRLTTLATYVGFSNRIEARLQEEDNTSRKVFGNQIDNSICGVIGYSQPSVAGISSEDERIYHSLVQANKTEFRTLENRIQQLARTVTQSLRSSSTYAQSTDDLDRLADDYINSFNNRIQSSNLGKRAFEDITGKIRDAASVQGWTSAGSWFLAITRAQGQLINGGFNIPVSTAPDKNQLGAHAVELAEYEKVENWLYTSYAPQDNRPTPASPGSTAPRYERSWARIFNVGGHTIDLLLWGMDLIASTAGVWTYGNGAGVKAFGDIGSTNNPFGEISAFGYKKIRAGLDFMGWALLSTVASTAASYGAEATSAAPGAKASPINMGLRGAAALFSGASMLLLTFATLFLMAGVILAFLVPILPFVKFFFAMLVWLGTLLEAMISLPFVALAHLTPKGDGFSGPNARQGYYYLFQIFLRPVLTIFGLIAALLMFYVAAKFLNAMYYEAAKGVGVFEYGVGFVAKVVFSVFYVGLIYICANTSFKLVEQIPAHALRWMGANVQEGQFEDQSTLQNLAAGAGAYAVNQFAQMPKQMIGDPLQKKFQSYKDDKKASDAKKASKDSENRMLLAQGYERGSDGNPIMTQGSPTEINQAKSDWQSHESKADALQNDIIPDLQHQMRSASTPLDRIRLRQKIADKTAEMNRHRSEAAAAQALYNAKRQQI